jgi:hypothetical protein
VQENEASLRTESVQGASFTWEELRRPWKKGADAYE